MNLRVKADWLVLKMSERSNKITTISEEEFFRLQEQLIDLRNKNYELIEENQRQRNCINSFASKGNETFLFASKVTHFLPLSVYFPSRNTRWLLRLTRFAALRCDTVFASTVHLKLSVDFRENSLNMNFNFRFLLSLSGKI